MTFDGMDRDIDSPDMAPFGAAATDGSEWRDVDRQLRRLASRRAALDAAELHWLREARRTDVHRHLGFGSLVEYLERTLGYQPRTALERLRVADALASLPAMSDALATGRLAYSAVRELSRIATVDTEREWLEHAGDKTVREIEAMVAGRCPGDRPSTPPDPDLEPRHLRLALSPDVYARFLAARRRLEEDTGEKLSDSDVMGALCDAVLAPPPDATRGPRYQIALTICEHCERGWQDAAGQVIEVGPEAIDLAHCDAQHLGRVDGDTPAQMTTDIPDAVRRQVERRDRRRCVVPGCRASTYLHMHHLQPRAHGGAHKARNLCLLCSGHHAAVHDGRLRITGQAPALRFVHDDGRSYGAPAPRPPRIDAHAADACLALRGLGFSAAQAASAIRTAGAHVSADASLEDWIRAALRACPRPASTRARP
jgi:hypothetical protein